MYVHRPLLLGGVELQQLPLVKQWVTVVVGLECIYMDTLEVTSLATQGGDREESLLVPLVTATAMDWKWEGLMS
jgi:hypothetical protein